LEEVVGQSQQLGAEQDRVRKDNQAKTEKLMDRIKELNQCLVAAGG
jgi:hypothetical protein